MHIVLRLSNLHLELKRPFHLITRKDLSFDVFPSFNCPLHVLQCRLVSAKYFRQSQDGNSKHEADLEARMLQDVASKRVEQVGSPT